MIAQISRKPKTRRDRESTKMWTNFLVFQFLEKEEHMRMKYPIAWVKFYQHVF